jgi:transcriptional regulator with XRE-family HTH domain
MTQPIDSAHLALFLQETTKGSADQCQKYAVAWSGGERNRSELGRLTGVSRNTATSWAQKIDKSYRPGTSKTVAGATDIERTLTEIVKNSPKDQDRIRAASELNRMQGNHAPEKKEILQVTVGAGATEAILESIAARLANLRSLGVPVDALLIEDNEEEPPTN